MGLLRRRAPGFTLLELILVAALLSIIIAVSAPQLKRTFDSMALYGFVSDLAALSRYAQAKAITAGARTRIRIVAAERQVLMEYEDKADDAEGGAPIGWKTEKARKIPPQIKIEAAEEQKDVVFYPDGTSTEEIKVFSVDETSYSVSFEGPTGLVNVNKVE